jgi:hypothetical protein
MHGGCAHAGAVTRTKQTAPRIIRISGSPSRRRSLACIQSTQKKPRERRVGAPDLGSGASLNSNAHFLFRKRVPNNAPPMATAAGNPRPNSGAGPLQMDEAHGPAHAGAVARTKQTAPRIARISNSPSLRLLAPRSNSSTIKP